MITNLSATAPNVNYAIVAWSWATDSIIPGPNVEDGTNNHNWVFSIPIVASWTLDTNDQREDRPDTGAGPARDLAERHIHGTAGAGAGVRGDGVCGGGGEHRCVRHPAAGGAAGGYQRHPDVAGDGEHDSRQLGGRRAGGAKRGHDDEAVCGGQRRPARDHLYAGGAERDAGLRSFLRACLRQPDSDGGYQRHEPFAPASLLGKPHHGAAGGDERKLELTRQSLRSARPWR